MSTTTAIAVYGGVVGTAALTLQLVSEWRSWGTRVEVSMRRMNVVTVGEPDEAAIVFTIINHSGHPVKITHLGVTPLEKGGEARFFPSPLPHPGPWVVPSRDAITLRQPPLRGGDPSYKARARVLTSDGKEFNSKRVRVRELLDPEALK